MKPLPKKRIILAITLGLTTTITIAWGCAIWIRINSKHPALVIKDIPLSELDPDFPIEWTIPKSNPSNMSFGRIDQQLPGIKITQFDSLDPFREDNRDSYWIYTTLGPNRVLVVHKTGWPFFVFECKGKIEATFNRNAQNWTIAEQWNHAFTPPKFLNPVACDAIFWYPGYTPPIPYHPLWTGLLLNTTLFTLAWSILLLGPTTLRHYFRKHKNRCTTCGYNLHNLKSKRCPECGTIIDLNYASIPDDS